MASHWYFREVTEIRGPFTEEQLIEFAEEGRIELETPVRKGSDGSWVRARDVKGLFQGPEDTSLETPRSPAPPPIPRRPPIPSGDHTPPCEGSQASTDPHNAESSRKPDSARHVVETIVLLFFALAAVVIMSVTAVHLLSRPSQEQIIAKCESSVAFIESPTGTGSGFLVSRDLLVTNRHVIEMAPTSHLTISFPSDAELRNVTFSGSVVYEATNRDLAVIELDQQLRYFLRLASERTLRRGQEIVVIGSPGVAIADSNVVANAVSRGMLSSITQIDGRNFYQLDISLNPGNSGGPVLDPHGRVIGVVTLKSGEEGLAFCIPLLDVRQAIERVRRLSDQDKIANSSWHDVRAVAKLIGLLGQQWTACTAIYVAAMQESLQNGGTVAEAVSAARQFMDATVSAQTAGLMAVIDQELSRLNSDRHVSGSLRKLFAQARSHHRSLQEFVDNPPGDLDSYISRANKLIERHEEITESLEVATGISDH